jgi:CHAD domain-containing protein
MNSAFPLPNGHPGTPLRVEELQRVEDWRQLVFECGRKPSRKRVHGLRVSTLRLQAEMEHWLRAGFEENGASRKARRWSKQADKLREALGPVREVDVFLIKLDCLRILVSGPEEAQSRISRSCLRQISLLEQSFAQRRKAAAKDLMAEIANRRERLAKSSKEIERVHGASWVAGSGASIVREMIAGLAAEFPDLNGDSLHALRKRIKMVRYLAEPVAAANSEMKWQVAALKRMQSAAGEWHDFQALSKKAARTFRGRHKGRGLAELLNTLAEESLEKALELCQRTMARLQKENAEEGASPQVLPPKLPARKVELIEATEKGRTA